MNWRGWSRGRVLTLRCSGHGRHHIRLEGGRLPAGGLVRVWAATLHGAQKNVGSSEACVSDETKGIRTFCNYNRDSGVPQSGGVNGGI